MEDVSDRPIADGRDDPIFDRLSSQIPAGPVGDVQTLGDRLQASQLNDLSPLEGGNPGRSPGPLGQGLRTTFPRDFSGFSDLR